jgi:hypothetical protein
MVLSGNLSSSGIVDKNTRNTSSFPIFKGLEDIDIGDRSSTRGKRHASVVVSVISGRTRSLVTFVSNFHGNEKLAVINKLRDSEIDVILISSADGSSRFSTTGSTDGVAEKCTSGGIIRSLGGVVGLRECGRS